MIDVLLVAGTAPQQQAVLAEAINQFRAQGARVRLTGYFDAGELAPEIEPTELHPIPPQRGSSGEGSAKPSARQVWLAAKRDSWLMSRGRSAALLVALDPAAVHTVWQLAQRNRLAVALFGLAPAQKALADGIALVQAGNRPSRQGPSLALMRFEARERTVSVVKASARRAVGEKVMRVGPAATFWRTAISVPGLPDGIRVKLTQRVQASLVKAGMARQAAEACSAAATRVGRPQLRLRLLADGVTAELAAGRLPRDLATVCGAELAKADIALAKGNAKRAAILLARTFTLLFDRVIHFDRLSSPLAEDPEKFLAPLYASRTMRTVTVSRFRATPAAPPPSDRPMRLLIVTQTNANFLREIRQRYEALPQVEVRFLDMAADKSRLPLIRGVERIIEHRLEGSSTYVGELEAWLRPHLDWADTVFVDWCMAPAGMLTLLDPGSTRVVVRLHSMETWTMWPHLADFSRVDDLVFVSEHLRDLTVAATPHLRGDAAPRLHVISNAMSLTHYPRPKPPEARFNLGLVGISSVAKDPRWAVEVLRMLRQRDPRYRLLLIGADLNPKVSPAAQNYHTLLEQDLAELEPTGAVHRVGQIEDVAGALTQVGVILSSSVRESFHCGLVEGAASGAVPVVRDWPFFAGKPTGARTLFPLDWVVETPQDAVDRILATTATENGWREAGRAASAHALANWDWPVTRRDFDRLLLGRDMSGPDPRRKPAT